MTTVNTTTGEITVSYGEVKQSVSLARESGAKFFEQIVWQIENQAWSVLGYADWDEMRDAEYGDIGVVVPRADRPEIVTRMRAAGMTQTQIADTLGVSQPTVHNDLNIKTDIEVPATVTTARGQERPTRYAERPPAPMPIDHAALADEAVADFPDLAYYRDEVNDPAHCWHLAEKLREYRTRGELDDRLGTLRRSIELDRSKRNGTYSPTPAPVDGPKTCPTCGQEMSD